MVKKIIITSRYGNYIDLIIINSLNKSFNKILNFRIFYEKILPKFMIFTSLHN